MKKCLIHEDHRRDLQITVFGIPVEQWDVLPMLKVKPGAHSIAWKFRLVDYGRTPADSECQFGELLNKIPKDPVPGVLQRAPSEVFPRFQLCRTNTRG
jgi:hypothetical protein